jgi:TPR repeat protein
MEGTKMGRVAKITCTIALVSCFAIPVTAAQIEDGIAAYERSDYTTALRLLSPLADQGDARALNNLGRMYFGGQGVPKDHVKAAQLHRRAAEQGYAPAENDLARMYYGGHGVPQSDTEAMRWYRMAADQGDMQAQFDLGLMYEGGHGVPRDYVQAHKWFSLSAQLYSVTATGAQDRAVRHRDRVATMMTPAQLAESERLVGEWRRK